ncbi:MAG: hypothetical protein HYX27_19890 [Acidobacteria bacterium]|nr:hypothetical protein [Acidobacteriota bacterium]
MRILPLVAALLATLPAAAQVGNLQISANSVNFSSTAGNSTPQTQVVGVSSTGAALPINLSIRYFTTTEGWLTATQDSAVTPSNVTITANAATLAAGNYTGQVVIVASATQSALVTVNFAVSSTGSGSGVLTASPSSVTLTSNTGLIAQAAVNISSSGSVPFQIFTNTTSGGNWLSVNTITGTSPTSFTITANPTGLLSGTYSGTVSVAPTNGSPGVAIPVTFNVNTGTSSGGFSVSPPSVNFLYQLGTATPSAQSVFVNNANGIVTYTATASAPWVKLSSNINTTPSSTITGSSNANMTIYVDPALLTAGTYNAQATLTATSGATQTVAISLTVGTSTLLTASPASLTFAYSASTGIPVSQQLTIQSTSGDVSFNASASSTGWLLVGPQFGSTGSSNVLTVSVAPTGLPGGTYSGAINVVTSTASISIPVTLTVNISGTSAITATPASLSFSAPLNGSSASQTLQLTALTTKNFLASASASGGNWLQVTPSSGSTPASLTVSISPQFVTTAGIYSGLVQISNLTDGTQLTVPVTMTISGTTLSASPSALTYSLTAGSPTPVSQVVQLTGSTSTVYSASSDSVWLSVSPNSGTTPANLTIFANAAALTAGNYTGIVTISAGGATTSVTVSATVSGTASPILSPANLSFLYASGAALPAAQTISVTSTLGALNFTTGVRTTSGNSSWLVAVPSGITTPATISISVQPAGLTPGTYSGIVTVISSITGESRSAEVTLTVTGPVAPSVRTTVHGATRELSALTPGMIVSVMGNSMGPSPGVRGTIAGSGAFETFYGGYRVLFDGIPAPILYISSTQIDTIVPYALAGRANVRVEVENSGVRSSPLNLLFSPDAAPGLFTLDSTGRGQAAALNQNGSINGPGNPASLGSVLVLYATGEGPTQPMGQEGRIILNDLRKPILPVSVNIGGVPVEVLYAGSAPGQVAGLMQVNVRLGDNVPRGNAVQVELRAGPAPSPVGVTVAIQ